jgi:hypothetical protein
MNADGLLASRSASPLAIVAVLATFTTWLLLEWAWFFSSSLSGIVARATHGLVGSTLLATWCVAPIVFAIMWGLGRLRLRDLGLSKRGVITGVVATVACWAIAQLLLATGALVAGEALARSTELTHDNGGEMIGQLFGNALYEEVVVRGFLFVQLVLLVRKVTSVRNAWVVAALVAAAAFALSHIPQRWANHDMHGTALAENLVWLAWSGLMLSFVYARTGHLEVAIGYHSLWNAPLPVVASPIAAGTAIIVVQVASMVAWPYVVRAVRSKRARPASCRHRG